MIYTSGTWLHLIRSNLISQSLEHPSYVSYRDNIFGNGENSSHFRAQRKILVVHGHTGLRVNTQRISIRIKQPITSPAIFEICTQSQYKRSEGAFALCKR